MIGKMIVGFFSGIIFLLISYTAVSSADYYGRHQWKGTERTLKSFIDEGFDIIGMTYGEDLGLRASERMVTTTYLLRKKNMIIRCRESISGAPERKDRVYSVHCSELTEVMDIKRPDKK